MGTVLLSTTYFGPVQWYQKLHRAEDVQIEQWESFQKQTYRNRCLIATTQGIQALTVPTERGGSPLIKDTRISDHGNWRHLHWNALQSAYGESPFFDYYQDDIRPFFEQRWDYLLDFNEAIRTKICELIDIQPRVVPTENFLCPAEIKESAFGTGYAQKSFYFCGTKYRLPLGDSPQESSARSRFRTQTVLSGVSAEARLPAKSFDSRPLVQYGA